MIDLTIANTLPDGSQILYRRQYGPTKWIVVCYHEGVADRYAVHWIDSAHAITSEYYQDCTEALQRAKTQTCAYCGGTGVVETELYEGLVNCPECSRITT